MRRAVAVLGISIVFASSGCKKIKELVATTDAQALLPESDKTEPLPAPTIVDQPGKSLAQPKDIAVGAVVEGPIGGDDAANQAHFYRFAVKPGEKLKLQVSKRSTSGGGGYGFKIAVVDPGENSVVPENWLSTYDTEAWVREEHDAEIPPPKLPAKYIVKVLASNNAGRYRFRIAP